MLALDRAGAILDANDAFCELVGYQWTALLGRTTRDITYPGDRGATRKIFSELLPREDWHVSFGKRFVRSDGELVPVRVSATWSPAFGCVVENVTDLSELNDARAQIQRAEARQAALIRYTSSLIFVVDAGGRFSDVNPATERLFGSNVGEDAIAVLRDLVHPDDAPAVMRAFEDSMQIGGQHEPLTFRARDRAGEWIYLEASGNNQLSNPDIAGMIINARDVTDRETRAQQIEANLKALLATLSHASEFRDPYIFGHQQRVGAICGAVGKRLGLDGFQIDGVRLAGQVHDIGKIALPGEILAYPGRLSPEQFALVKTHSQVGHDILAGITFPWPIAETVLQHHERIDGSGYPRALTGDDILIEARIVAVADVAEAMTSHRPYRPALDLDAALDELANGKGIRYDPDVVDAYVAIAAD